MGIPHSSSQELTQEVLNEVVLCLRNRRAAFEYHCGEVSQALYPNKTERLLAAIEQDHTQKQKQIDYLVAHELNGTWWFISSVYCWWYDIDLKDTQRYILGILNRLYHGRLQVDNLLPGERAFVSIFQSKSLAPLFVFMKSISIGLEALQSFGELIRRTWAAFISTKVSSQKTVVIQAGGNTMKSLPARQPSKQTVWHEHAVQAVSESNERVSECSREFNQHAWPAAIVVPVDGKAYSTKAAYDTSEKQIRFLLKRTEEGIQMCAPAAFGDLELLRQDWEKTDKNIAYIIANIRLWKSADPRLDSFSKEQVKKHFSHLQAIVQRVCEICMPLLKVHETTLRIIRLQKQVEKSPDLPDIHDKEDIKQYFGIQNASSKAALWQESYCSMNKMNTELHELEQTNLREVTVGDVSGREAVAEVAEKLGRMQQSAQACAKAYMQVMFEEAKETIRKAMIALSEKEGIDIEPFESDMHQEIERFSVEVVCFSEEVCPGLNVKKVEHVKALKAFLREMRGRLLVLALLPVGGRASRMEEYNTSDKEKEEDEKHKAASVAQELSAEIEAIQNGLSRFDEQLSEMDKMSLILNYAIRLFHFSSEKKASLDPGGLHKQKRLFEWLKEAGKDAEKSEWEMLDNKVLEAYKRLNTAFAQCLQKMTGKPSADISRLSQFIQRWNASIGQGEVDGDIVYLRQFFNEKEEKLQSLEVKEKAPTLPPTTGQAPAFVARMTTWVSQVLSPMTLSQRWQAIEREQEASHKAFLELLEEKVPEKRTRKAADYVQYFREKHEEYEKAFVNRYNECGDIENATGLHLVVFKEQYIGYKKEIEQARHYLEALESPAGAVDEVGYETSSDEIRKKTHALFLKAAPDRNQSKGVLVAKLTHLMMKFMLRQKEMLLSGNKEGDKLGVQPFYDRFNAIDDEVDALGIQCRAMAAALKKHELLGTEIVPVYDPERVNAIEREFNDHVYKKVEEKKITQHDAWLLTGRFTEYCYILNEVAKIIIDWMKNTMEMHEKIRVAEAKEAEERAGRVAEEKGRAAAEADRAAAEATLRQYGEAMLAGFREAIAEGTLRPDEPAYLELDEAYRNGKYVGLNLPKRVTVLEKVGGRGYETYKSICSQISSEVEQDESHQPADLFTATQNGVFLSNGGSATSNAQSNKAGSVFAI